MKFKHVKPDFVDDRGEIIRPLSDIIKEKIKSVSLIISEAGAIRGNHYHPKEGHHMYVVEGEMEYLEKKANSKKAKIKRILLKKGDILYTEPMVTHAVIFKKKSIVFYFSNSYRTKKGDLGDTFREVLTINK